jgi:hypothetical protein
MPDGFLRAKLPSGSIGYNVRMVTACRNKTERQYRARASNQPPDEFRAGI